MCGFLMCFFVCGCLFVFLFCFVLFFCFFYLWDVFSGMKKVYQNMTTGKGFKLDHIQVCLLISLKERKMS